MLAIGVLKGCQQAGIQVPQQMSITGFDNITFSAYTNPPLTTLDQPKRSIGAEAARLLLTLLNSNQENPSFQPQQITLKGNLLVRQSTAQLTNREKK
jgi:LacI family transcriptional regulator